MAAPKTVQQFYQYQHPDNDWSDFEPTTPYSHKRICEATRETWERPWDLTVMDQPINLQRTEDLAKPEWDTNVKVGIDGVDRNVHDGVPFAYCDGEPEYPIYHKGMKFFSRPTRAPLPNPFPRLGDPTGFMGDLQFFGIDRFGLWEFSSIGPVWWRGGNLEAGNHTRWLFNSNWYDQKTGMTGAKIPFLPGLPSLEELDHGIHHALHMVILYGKEAPVYPARSQDRLSELRLGMPLRAGERMRLNLGIPEIEARLGRQLTTHEINLVICLQTFGAIVDDIRPGPHGQVRMPMDYRVRANLIFRLSDFVVLEPISREETQARQGFFSA